MTEDGRNTLDFFLFIGLVFFVPFTIAVLIEGDFAAAGWLSLVSIVLVALLAGSAYGRRVDERNRRDEWERTERAKARILAEELDNHAKRLQSTDDVAQ